MKGRQRFITNLFVPQLASLDIDAKSNAAVIKQRGG